MASASRGPIDAAFHLAENNGFCSPGVFEPTKWAPGQPSGLKAWGSFCAGGNQATGAAVTSSFTAPKRFGFYLAGYVSNPGLTLEIEDLSKHSRLTIIPTMEAREQWRYYDVRLPTSWWSHPVRLLARDSSTDVEGWLAFTEPVASNGIAPGFGEANRLLLRTLLYFLLTIFPALALGTFAVRKGLRDLVLLGLAELAAIGASGYLGFCLWFLAPKLGHLFSFLLPFATAGWTAWNYRLLDSSGRQIVRRLLRPLALAGAASLLVLSVGFLYGGLDRPLETPASRFSHFLPGDNRIPYEFSEALKEGHIPKMGSFWHSSDRPPLQTGIVLSQYTYTSNPRDFDYTIIGVILQSLWIFAAWLLLTAFELDTRAIVLVLAVCLLSGFVFLNTFYVWPKLLAATYILAALAILFTPRYVSLQTGRISCILVGAMLAFAMLSHGGSAFAVIGIFATMAILRRFVPIKSLLLMAVTLVLLYTPWTLYQKFCDPPGDRLLKMHLAGIKGTDSRSFGRVFISAYGALTPRKVLSNKIKNLNTLIGNSGGFWIETAHLIGHIFNGEDPAWVAAALRGWMFFYFLVNQGFLVVGPVTLLAGIAKRYRTREWRTAAILWIFIAVTAAAWCLLMFGPATTVIHQGTYAIVLLGYAGSILAIWNLSRFAALLVSCCQICLSVLLYILLMQPPAAHALLAQPPALLGCLLLSAFSLSCLAWLLVGLYRTALGPSTPSRVHQELTIALGPRDRALD